MKKNQQGVSFMQVMAYFKPLRWRILILVLLGIVGIGLYSLMPNYTEKALSAIGSSDGVTAVMRPLLLYLVLCVFSEGFNFVCKFIIIKLEYLETVQILDAARRKLDVVPLPFIEQFEIGQTTRRVAVGSKLFQQCLATTYQIFRVVFFFILNVIMMSSLQWTLTLLVTLSLPLTILIASFVIKKTQKYYTLNGSIETNVYNFTEERSTLHGFFNENGLVGKDEFNAINQSRGAIAVDTVVGLNETYINFIMNFMYLALTVVFGMLVINQTLDASAIPTLSAFLIYSNRFLSNTKIVATTSNVVQPTKTIAEVFFTILDCPDDVTADEDTSLKKINSSIIFDHVTSEKVKDISLEIPFGSTVAFLEEDSGTGAALVELMTKLSLPKEGQIRINNKDVARIRSKSLYERVGVCFDRPFIIDATIAENIMYGVGKTLPENVIAMTSLFGFDSFIRALPNGYDTRLTESTVLLTNAEQQAINLTRTVLHAPDVLILNNALTNFDTLSEKKYNEIIIKKFTDRTRIFVTNKAKTIQNVDKIFVCQGGRIVEAGTHQELMALQGVYCARFTNN